MSAEPARSVAFERRIEWSPAYTKIAEGYGRGCVTMRFVLIGAKGAVQFVLLTGWYTSADRDADKCGGVPCADGLRRPLEPKPFPTDLGYHSLEPRYEGQSVQKESCAYLDGKPCYYDGSTLNAEDPFDVLTDDGDKALWTFLERYYAMTFEDAEAPPELGRRWEARHG